MIKDYFQDIVPVSHDIDDDRSHASEALNESDSGENEHTIPIRSIRNIAPPNREWSTQPLSTIPGAIPPRSNRHGTGTSMMLWVIASVCVLLLALFSLFALRATTVTITPRSQSIIFDKATQFTAYPAATAATGTLAYTVISFDVQDSETVAAQGTTRVERKASGTITVYNNYNPAPVKLVKNTRFQTEAGLIFRAPNDIVIPAKSVSAPGQVDIMIIADKAGSSYNISTGSSFKLPGLASSPKEYAGVYARSASDITGGSSGMEPAVAPADQTAAISQIRARLESKINDAVASYNTATTTALAGLARITYTEGVSSQGATSTSVSLNETAHVELPLFASVVFTQNIAQAVIVDTENVSITFIPGKDFTSLYTVATSTTVAGSKALSFTLSGSAQLVWNVDVEALKESLVGRDGGAFNTIITGFPGIVKAHASIAPFWRNSFPKNSSDIKIVVGEPQSLKQ